MPVPVTRDFAVKFGRDPSLGLEGQRAFPFIYTFVHHNDDTWKPVTPLEQPSLSCIGPTVPANSVIQHNVVLDPDHNFKLLSIKYTCYKWVVGVARWYTVISAVNSDGMDQDMDFVGTPLHKFVGITLSFQGSGNSAILYGGPDTGPIYASRRIPLPLDAIQGYEYGFLTTRTPYLLPRQGIMSFEITNTSPYDVVVGAAIYGMKIRV
jgi:hypothetical protein